MPEKKRILVVDDENIVRESLTRILGGQGYHVDTADSAAASISMLGDSHYDLILTDLMMHGMDGIELIKEVRRRGNETPFIMITGYPTIRTAVEALRVGASDYVTKPFARQEIIQSIRRALKLKEQKGDAAPVEVYLPQTEAMEQSSFTLLPGDKFCMRGHAWAEYAQDGTVRIGLDRDIMEGEEGLSTIDLPEDGDLVEQGYPILTIVTLSGESYSIFSPLTGQIIEINQEARENPASIEAATWLVRIIPSNLKEEIKRLSGC